MKSMTKKKIGGFMCHSPAATAVCMTPDSRSVIVPGRRSASERNTLTNCNYATATFPSADLINSRLLDTVRYSKLDDYRRNNNNNNDDNYDYGNDNRHLRRRNHNQYHNDQSQRKSISSAINNNGGALRNNNSVVIGTDNNDEQQIIKPEDLKKSSPVLADSVPDNVFQVVVMRVSLHCQGCAGKLKKHLSKMEGVTSFSIELEHKRVTVMGHVSPVVVLENISKVRRAEFWPASASVDQYHNQF